MPRGTETRPTAPLEAEGDHALIRQFRLEIVSGPESGAAATSSGARMVVGTSREADFVLRDSAVSRFHVELAVTDGKLVVRDLGSRNGTRVDGISVREA